MCNEQELRIEDYEAGRKSGATGSTGFTGLTTSTSSAGGLFGATSTGFGTTSTFGQKPATGFGTAGIVVFFFQYVIYQNERKCLTGKTTEKNDL